MKALYHFRTRGSGAEAVHISGVAGAFEELEHEVEFFNPGNADPRRRVNPYEALSSPGFFGKVSRTLPRWVFELLEIGYNAWAWWPLWRRLTRGGFGLLYERHAFFLIVGASVARARRVPLIVEVNELVGDERVSRQPMLAGLARACDRFVFRRADLIVVVSPHLRRRIEALGIAGEKVLVQPNAVDWRQCDPPADGSEVRARHGLAERVVIGFVGWFVPWHRVDLLVAAFAEVHRQRPETALLLVAEGPLLGELEAQAQRLGVADSVRFAGAVAHDAVPQHIAAMDICVVPNSNAYRSPLKLFEYMAQGRAVVAPRVEPIEMVLRDRANGLLFAPGESASLADALRTSVEDAALRQTLGRQAREDVRTKHTWRENVAALLAALASAPRGS